MSRNYVLEENFLLGINKIVGNACDLLDDATLLYQNKKYERAFGFYQLSINEINEAYCLLRNILFFNTTSGKSPELSRLLIRSNTNNDSWIINNLLSMLMKKIVPQMNVCTQSQSPFKTSVWQNGMRPQLSGNKVILPKESISKEDAEKKRDDACKELADKQRLINCIVSNYQVLKIRINELDLYTE